MNITFKISNVLPVEAINIRNEVFVIEQGFVDEFDEDDDKAIHIVMFNNEKSIGTSRIIYSKVHNSVCIGRFAIIKDYRNLGLGRLMLLESEKEIIKKYGHVSVGVSAQEEAEAFYAKCGYTPTKERYLDQNHPHVWMVKNLK